MLGAPPIGELLVDGTISGESCWNRRERVLISLHLCSKVNDYDIDHFLGKNYTTRLNLVNYVYSIVKTSKMILKCIYYFGNYWVWSGILQLLVILKW